MRFVVPSLGGGDARIEGRNRSWVSRFAAVALWWCGALAGGTNALLVFRSGAEGPSSRGPRHHVVSQLENGNKYYRTYFPRVIM